MAASSSSKSGAIEPGRIVSVVVELMSFGLETRSMWISFNAGFVIYRIIPNMRPSIVPASSSFLCESDANILDMV